MSDINPRTAQPALLRFGRRGFIAWTVFSALATWLALSVAEGLAAEACRNDGLVWNWRSWSCVHSRGIIILPPGLRRASIESMTGSPLLSAT